MMETSLIEQLDKSRYNLLKWTTIGWAIWFATIIGNNVSKGHILVTIAYWVGLLGSTIFMINLIKFLKLKRELRWNNKLKEALENELHVLNLHKSYQIGYWTVIGITILFLFVSIFTTVSPLLVTELILYFGVLAVLISGLIYNRD
ncbi:MAG TPA: hypothetical protein DCL77_20560 [Prolixibacteraceae bacterium]|jgi:hypothetical protein|nr:hypothetical protein [Prolixibacteraceae bacterium]